MNNLKYILYSLIAVVFSYLLHEFSHWLMGEYLGNRMVMTLNTGYPISLSYLKESHYTIISAVGPLITLLQTIIFYFLIKHSSQKYLYPFLFAGFYLELLSGILNLRNPNDLGRISETFHLGLLTIPIIFVAIHFMMVYKTSIREKYSLKFNLLTLLWILIFSSILILVNQKYKVVIL